MKYIPLNIGKQYVPGIYSIESRDGKVYIGSAVSLRTRFMTHRRCLEVGRHDNSRLQNYYRKYGIDSFCFKVLEYCDRSELIEREQYYIDILNPFFNIARTAGATYGLKPWLNKSHSQETKQKIKLSNLATFAKRPKKQMPQKLTKEQNWKRLSELNKTAEGRKRCSEMNKGNTNWLGKKHSPATIANRTGELNGRARAVYCVELNMTFGTARQASAFFGIRKPAVSQAILRGRKVVGKYTMQYAETTD